MVQTDLRVSQLNGYIESKQMCTLAGVFPYGLKIE